MIQQIKMWIYCSKTSSIWKGLKNSKKSYSVKISRCMIKPCCLYISLMKWEIIPISKREDNVSTVQWTETKREQDGL